MATRRIGPAAFDHGAQHFSIRSELFAVEIRRLVQLGAARVWLRSQSVTHPDRGIEERFVGVHGMRRIPEVLSEGLRVITGVAVERMAVARSGVAAIADGTTFATADAAAPVVLAGELFAGARVEGAYTSGLVASGMVLDFLA